MSDALQVLAAVATIIAAVVAAGAFILAWQQAREATRPNVVAEFVSDPLIAARAALVVHNYGLTPARNLRVSFTPEPLSSAGNDLADLLMHRYRQTFPSLAPRRSMSNTYWIGDSAGENQLGLPADIVVHVRYEGRRSRWERLTPKFQEDFTLTIEALKGGTRTTRSTKGKELDRIAAAMEAYVRNQP